MRSLQAAVFCWLLEKNLNKTWIKSLRGWDPPVSENEELVIWLFLFCQSRPGWPCAAPGTSFSQSFQDSKLVNSEDWCWFHRLSNERRCACYIMMHPDYILVLPKSFILKKSKQLAKWKKMKTCWSLSPKERFPFDKNNAGKNNRSGCQDWKKGKHWWIGVEGSVD